jgi:glutamine phosphoribosylpyrophosphate amidotransferase
MCAVIGLIIQKPSKEDFDMIHRVFLESKIRGMHATGMSFLPKWSFKIETIQEPIPADKFVEKYLHNDNLSDMLAEDGNLYLIGHCRYSTSDLEYNQPLYYNEKSIVHNGVITQELPEKWKDLYGYDCITKNDSELVLHSEDPLNEFSHMSMGVVELYLTRRMRFYRNGKRPLYFTAVQNGYVVTSTPDIAKRAGLEMSTAVQINTYMTIDSNLTTDIKKVYVDNLDLQEVEYETISI